LTRPLQKRRERFFAEEAARLLGKNWNLGEDREHPDFVVAEDYSNSAFKSRKSLSGHKIMAVLH
jgi:hypothetical protein